MKLYLVQHGQAKSKEEDPERPLTDAGVETVSRVARFLSDAVRVAEIRHSTKLRARQTADHLARGLGLDVPIREVPNLEPLDEVTGLAEGLAAETSDLMLVGHLPHLAKLAAHLVCGAEGAESFGFQQGGVLCLERLSPGEASAERPRGWTVRWMIVPDLVNAPPAAK